MIDRDRENDAGNWIVTCDNCEREERLGNCAGFKDVVDTIKSAGWKVRKHGDAWEHTCGRCERDDSGPPPGIAECPQDVTAAPSTDLDAASGSRGLPTLEARAGALYQILRRAESPVVSKVLDVLTDDELRNLYDLCEAHVRERGL